jgi:DNA polymerase-3 subunit chi
MKAKIEFRETDSPRLDIAICRVVAELYSAGERVCVLASSAADAALLDALLWTFEDQSFIPHTQAQGDGPVVDQVAIVLEPSNPNGATTLVVAGNVGREPLLEAVEMFGRVIDFAPKSPKGATEAARERYRVLAGAGREVLFIPLGK